MRVLDRADALVRASASKESLMLTVALLDHIWPRAPHSLVAGIVAACPTILPKYGITTTLEAAHLGAQCSVESAAGTRLEESLHYSAARAHQVWPSRFPSVAAAAPYARSPRLLADRVYGSRMGNRPGTDDGFNFRGRGLLQLTGRDEYERVGKECGLDLLGNPDLVSAPASCLEVACAFFKMSGALAAAAKDQIVAETKLINGGLIGLAEREAWLRRLKHEFGLT